MEMTAYELLIVEAKNTQLLECFLLWLESRAISEEEILLYNDMYKFLRLTISELK